MASLFAQLDAQLDQLFSGWNTWSTTLVVVLIAVLFSPLFFDSEPDVHPFLLARQANASPVRKSGESAVYRSTDIPHGYPLRSGLNVKDENASKWGPGRDGDLRDIWRSAAKAGSDKPGKILVLRGNNLPSSVTFNELSRQINIIGKHIQSAGGKRVAILLPNSTEFLVTLFACAFYGLTPVLIPIDISQDKLEEITRQTQVDTVVAPSGVVSAQDLGRAVSKAKSVILVTQAAGQHMDITGEAKDGSTEWHSLIAAGNSDLELPVNADPQNVPNIISVWQVEKGSEQIVEYTQANIVAAVAAQLAVLPMNHSFKETDLLVSLGSFTQSYNLTVTLAALHAHASIAITSVAGLAPDYALAFQGNIKPSIIIASSATMSKAHARLAKENEGFLQRIHKSRKASRLAAGTMQVLSQQSPRLIYIPTSAGEVPLSSQDLNELRIFTGSRNVRALTYPQVAGAIAQTSPLDYRIDTTAKKSSHFGPPLSCVELKVIEGQQKIADDDYVPQGQLVVAGPAVVGKTEVNTGLTAKFGDDQTLQLV